MTDRLEVLIWLALMGGVMFAAVTYTLLTVMDLDMPRLPTMVLRSPAPWPSS